MLHSSYIKECFAAWVELELAGLASCILYLYIKGAWYDPVKWIEVVEVAMCCVFMVLGVTLAVKRFIRLAKED